MKRTHIAFLAALLLVLSMVIAPPANAVPYTMTDGNSSATVDPENSRGMYDWSVNGANQLYSQTFLYRIGSGSAQFLSNLPSVVYQDPNRTNSLELTFSDAANGLTFTVNYILGGGAPGSSIADMSELISVSHVGADLDFHFFQYSDFDLGGDLYFLNTAQFPNVNAVVQTSAGAAISETAVVPAPNHREIALYDSTLQNLLNVPGYNLNDLPLIGVDFGPADLTWAFQWDRTLGNNDSLLISKDKQLEVVPVPPSAILLGSGLLGLVGLRWSRGRKES